MKPNTKVVYTESPANPTCRLLIQRVTRERDARRGTRRTAPLTRHTVGGGEGRGGREEGRGSHGEVRQMWIRCGEEDSELG